MITVDGHLYWIVDAYTATNRYPYSEPYNAETDVDYVRNSVKVVIDTYTGEVYEVRSYTYEEYEPDEYGEIPYFPDYTEETIKEFRKGVDVLKKAQVYAKRIDWLISGDDGEESFHKGLKKKLKELEEV